MAPGLDIEVLRGFLADADAHLGGLLDETPWAQGEIIVYGERRPIPRLEAWYGDPGSVYTYSGRTMEPLPWTERLAGLRDSCARAAGTPFDSVLVNRYRNGADAVGWHSDDEPELGHRPIIASMSLGATRRFRLRRRDRRYDPVALDLEHGDLLVMRGQTQGLWEHCLARTARPVGERVNLTFRRIVGPAASGGRD
ncbi:MAG: alpha-ketoglutarate-dependent dioxygenase AlkB [Actinobacteria bacterium]|nr:alpha-ketoglutarate-dependent dioxygenase AlkB [Actinomycetota bacterium]